MRHRQHVDEHHALGAAPASGPAARRPAPPPRRGGPPLRGRLAEEARRPSRAPAACGSARRPGSPRRCRRASGPCAEQHLAADLDGAVHQRLDQLDQLVAGRASTSRSTRLALASWPGRGGGPRTSVRSERAHLARSAASAIRCSATRSPREGRSGLLLKRSSRCVDDAVVEVDAAQEGVAAGGDHLEDVVAAARAPRRRRCRRPGRRPGPAGAARGRSRRPAPPRSAR